MFTLGVGGFRATVGVICYLFFPSTLFFFRLLLLPQRFVVGIWPYFAFVFSFFLTYRDFEVWPPQFFWFCWLYGTAYSCLPFLFVLFLEATETDVAASIGLGNLGTGIIFKLMCFLKFYITWNTLIIFLSKIWDTCICFCLLKGYAL